LMIVHASAYMHNVIVYGTTGVCYEYYLLHNDRREKKELPNGRVISVVAQTGWQLCKFEAGVL